jgi:hypothetical protein
MKVVYVAHPLGAGPDRTRNITNATKWVAWIARVHNVAPVASWILLASEWEETAENRARGLAIDEELIRVCDELWLVGGRISPGMEFERDVARRLNVPVSSLLHLGYEPPPADGSRALEPRLGQAARA